MELTIASETRVQKQRNGNSHFAMQPVIQAMLLDWQLEAFFLKKKAAAIIKFMSLGYVSDKCFVHKKAYFKKELFQFVNEDFPFFQKKISKHINKWSSNWDAQENSFEMELGDYREIQDEWQELKRKFWQLEMQILEGVFQNYPVRII